MLVLSRHVDESIIIGNDIVVTIVQIRGDKVRLGITAPAKVTVHRREVYEAIKRGALRRREANKDAGPEAKVASDQSATDGIDTGLEATKLATDGHLIFINPAMHPLSLVDGANRELNQVANEEQGN